MADIDIFFQGEHLREMGHLRLDVLTTVEVLRAQILERHGGGADVFIFLEDAEEPLEPTLVIGELFRSGPGKVHVHRCRRIEVTVFFGPETATGRFGPGATVAHVKHWATEKHFHMTPGDATEHRLQVTGTHERPPPGTHIGTMVSSSVCLLSFDLVPDKRIQGSGALAE